MPQQTTGQPQNPQPPAAQTAAAPPPPPRPVVPPEFDALPIWTLTAPKLVAILKDNVQSWKLKADGAYRRLKLDEGEERFSAHEYFMTNPSLSGRGSHVKVMPHAIEYVGSSR